MRYTLPIHYKAIDLQSEAAKARYWGAFERMRGRWYGAVEAQVTKRFKEESQAINTALSAALPQDTMTITYRIIDEQRIQWEKQLQAVYYSVGEEFAPIVGGTLNPPPKSIRAVAIPPTVGQPGDEVFANTWRSIILNYIKGQCATKITQVSETTKEIIRLNLAEAVDKGETMLQIMRRIQGSYHEMSLYRAEMIARTEVINASNAASYAGAKASGADVQKEWLASRDKRTRHDHTAEAGADGQVVPMDKPFIVGGYQLMWPGDSSLGAPGKEVINCRCTLVYTHQ